MITIFSTCVQFSGVKVPSVWAFIDGGVIAMRVGSRPFHWQEGSEDSLISGFKCFVVLLVLQPIVQGELFNISSSHFFRVELLDDLHNLIVQRPSVGLKF